MATTASGANLAVGDWVYLEIGSATCHTAVAVESVSGTVIAATAKAVQIRAQAPNGSDSKAVCWFPRRALIKCTDRGGYRLARWFRPDEYASRFLARAANVSCVSVA